MKSYLLSTALKGGILLSALSLSGCLATADFFGDTAQSMCETAAQARAAEIRQSRPLTQSQINARPAAKKIQNAYHQMQPVAARFNFENKNLPMNWNLDIFQDDTVNAYAYPCGMLGFYTGLVEKLNLTEAETAAIMGHEMSHTLLEHTRQSLGGQHLMTIPMLAASLSGASSVLSALAIGDEYGLRKPFSRTNELEADVVGMLLMAQAGYDPRAAISAEQKLGSYKGTALDLDFLSTHPANATRVEAMRRMLPEALLVYEGKKNIYTDFPDVKKIMKKKSGHSH